MGTLAESTAHLERLVERAPVAIAVLKGPDLEYLSANAAYRSLMGPDVDFVGRKYRDVLPERAASGTAERLREVMRTGEPWKLRDYETEVPGRPGTTWWDGECLPLENEHGEFDSVLVLAWEVTDRKLAERAREENEKRLRLLTESSPAFVFETDAKGAVIYSSGNYYTYSGAERDGSGGLAWHANSMVHPEDLPHLQDRWRESSRLSQPFEIELRLRRYDGEYRWFLNRAVPRFAPDGTLTGWIGTSIDIHERRRAEQALRENEERLRKSEDRYRAIIESQTEMVCRFRPDGTILFVNDAYARSNGTTAEDLEGRSFWELVSEEDRETVRAQLHSLTPEAPEILIENRFMTAEGERWTLWSNRAVAFDEEGRLLEAQSSGIDITERKRMEEELREASRLKDELLGLVSHEFRTPLTIIAGNIDLLTRRFHALPEDVLEQTLGQVRLESERLRRLIENMLFISRGERGTSPHIEPVLLQRTLPRIVTEQEQRDPSRPIALSLTTDLPPALGSVDYLEQVLDNLLSNARKYGRRGTAIHVEATVQDGQARIVVRDDGEELDPSQVQRFFEPFHRDESAASGIGGAGLGLAVVVRLVQAMDGTLSARPNPGGGLEVAFTLPLAEAGAAEELELALE